jgi:hypothetical protein
MADLWFVLVIVAFFGVCVALVWSCDRIIGPDDATTVDEPTVEPVVEGAAR